MTISLAVPDILVARAKSGDLEALEALYRAFETPVYNLASRMLRSPEDAEDVLQETFLEVVRSIKQYRAEGHLWGWIRQIAASKALMRIRRNQVRATEELHEEVHQGGGGAGAAHSTIPARGALARVGVRDVSGGARCAVSARGAAQGLAGAAPPAGPLARRTRGRDGRAAAAARALGRLECGGGRGGRGVARVPAVRHRAGKRRRSRFHQAGIGDARAAARA